MIIDVEEAPSSFKIQQSSGQKRWRERGREGGREGGRQGGGSSLSAWEVLLGEESLPPFMGLGMGSP